MAIHWFDGIGKWVDNFAKNNPGIPGATAEAVKAPFGLIADVVTAPWGSHPAEAASSAMSSGVKRIGETFSPVGQLIQKAPYVKDVIEASNNIYQKTSDIATTAINMTNFTKNPYEGNLGETYQASKGMNIGEAIASSPLLGNPFAYLFSKLTGKGEVTNIFDKQQLAEANQENPLFKTTSGLTSAYVGWKAYPLTVGGKLAKIGKESIYNRPVAGQSEKLAEEAVPGATSKGAQAYQSFDNFIKNNDAATIENHPAIAKSADPKLLASTLAKADDATRSMVLGVARGDVNALSDLLAKHGELQTQIDRYAGALDVVKEGGEVFVKFPGQSKATLIKDSNKEILDNELKMAQKNDAYLNNIAQVKSSMVNQQYAGTPWLEKLNQLRAENKIAATFGATTEKPSTGWVSDIYQKSYLSRPIRTLHWLGDSKPNNYVDFNSPIGGDTLRANLRNATMTGYDSSKATELWNSWINAMTSSDKINVMKKIEDEMVGHEFDKANLSLELKDAVLQKLHGERDYISSELQKAGYFIDPIEGVRYESPALISQLANGMHMLPIEDLRTAIRKYKNSLPTRTAGDIAKNGVFETKDALSAALEVFNSTWKFGTLFRAGYPQRIVADEQIRMLLATEGAANRLALGSLGNYAAGKINNNFISNMVKKQKFTVGHIVPAQKEYELLDIQAGQLRKQIQMLEDAKATHVPFSNGVVGKPVTENVGLDAAEQFRQELAEVEKHKQVLSNYILDQKEIRKLSIGKQQKQDSTVVNINGENFNGPFAGTQGEIAKSITSGADTAVRMIVGENNLLKPLRRTRSAEAAITPDMPQHTASWEHVLNAQISNDLVARLLMDPKMTERKIISALRETQEGKFYLNEQGIRFGDEADHIEKIRHMVDTYAPTQALRDKILDKSLKAQDLIDLFPDRMARPVVHSDIVEDTLGTSNFAKRALALRGNLMKWLGSVGPDVLSRSPYYQYTYFNAIENRMAVAREQGMKSIDSETKATWERQAHQEARKTIREKLYDFHKTSNFAALFHFLSPFIQAWEEQLKSYGRIMIEDPSAFGKLQYIWNTPYRNGLVYDENNNPVSDPEKRPKGPGGVPSDPNNDKIVAQVPTELAKILGMGVDSLQRFEIPMSSLNVVAQGNPWWSPGGGYLLQIPLSKLVINQPNLENSLKFLMPYGPSATTWDAIMPSSLRKGVSLSQREDARDYGNTAVLIGKTEIQKYKDGLRETMPTWKEIENRTSKMSMLKLAMSLMLPVTVKFDTPYRPYIDAYYKEMAADPAHATENFYNKYPDYFIFAGSTSKNTTGVPATPAAVQVLKDNKDLVASLADIDPKYVSLLTFGVPGGQKPTTGARMWLEQNKIPGSKLTFRTTKDPKGAVEDAQAQEGWQKYRAFMNKYDHDLIDLGLSPRSSSPIAQDKNQEKKDFVDNLTKDNPYWYKQYKLRDSGKAADTTKALTTLVTDPKFWSVAKNDKLWNTVVEYLNLRVNFRNQLKDAADFGGSASLTAKSNTTIADDWATATTNLKAKDLQFSELFNYWLQNDDLSKG
jgi:hypothetical protein